MSKKTILLISVVAFGVASAVNVNTVKAKNSPAIPSNSKEIFFDYNQYDLDIGDKVAIKEQAKYLVKNPHIKIKLVGNTGNQGPAKAELILGQKRALAVKNELVKFGVKASNIEIISYGGEFAKKTKEGKKTNPQNYRVDFINNNVVLSQTKVAPNMTEKRNIYVNLNSGISSFKNLSSNGVPGSINAGYEFNKYVAAELGYNLFLSNQYGTRVTMNFYDVAAKGTLPLSASFSLYGRGGLGIGSDGWAGKANASCYMCTHDYNASYLAGLLGAGISYKINSAFSVRVEDYAILPFVSTLGGNINTVVAGVQYNF